MKSLPTKKDFGDMADLDVRRAWKTFGGKSVDEAYTIFIANAFAHQEHFWWMATPSFAFYFPIVARYIMSDEARGDSDTVSSFAHTLAERAKSDAPGIHHLAKDIRLLCDHVVKNYDSYDLSFDIYGDVKKKYEQIRTLTDSDADGLHL